METVRQASGGVQAADTVNRRRSWPGWQFDVGAEVNRRGCVGQSADMKV